MQRFLRAPARANPLWRRKVNAWRTMQRGHLSPIGSQSVDRTGNGFCRFRMEPCLRRQSYRTPTILWRACGTHRVIAVVGFRRRRSTAPPIRQPRATQARKIPDTKSRFRTPAHHPQEVAPSGARSNRLFAPSMGNPKSSYPCSPRQLRTRRGSFLPRRVTQWSSCQCNMLSASHGTGG